MRSEAHFFGLDPLALEIAHGFLLALVPDCFFSFLFACLVLAALQCVSIGLLSQFSSWSSSSSAFHEASAARLVRLCQLNGGLYVKAAQYASAINSIPKEYARELARMQVGGSRGQGRKEYTKGKEEEEEKKIVEGSTKYMSG